MPVLRKDRQPTHRQVSIEWLLVGVCGVYGMSCNGASRQIKKRCNRSMEQESDGMSGFYFAYRLTDEIGLSFAVVYIPHEKDLQISLMFGCLMLAVGYKGVTT